MSKIKGLAAFQGWFLPSQSNIIYIGLIKFPFPNICPLLYFWETWHGTQILQSKCCETGRRELQSGKRWQMCPTQQNPMHKICSAETNGICSYLQISLPDQCSSQWWRNIGTDMKGVGRRKGTYIKWTERPFIWTNYFPLLMIFILDSLQLWNFSVVDEIQYIFAFKLSFPKKSFISC